jgi:hypothetical protein
MQNTNAYKIQSYAVFSGFTNSIIISLCSIKSSNQMCDGRLNGRTDRHVHPSLSTPLKATRVFYFFYFPRCLFYTFYKKKPISFKPVQKHKNY